MPKKKFTEWLRNALSLSPRERRGILWLLPVLGIVGLLFAFAGKPRFDRFPELAAGPEVGESTESTFPWASHEAGNPEDEREYFEFDPNTVTLQELCRLGFSAKTAAGIIKYRTKGKRFEIPEDFATCYGVSLEHYTALEPYIVIGEEYRAKPATGKITGGNGRTDGGASKRRSLSARPFDPNELDAEGFSELGFSAKQAQVIINYRESRGGFLSPEDFAKCYVVSEEMFAGLEPYIRISPDSKPENAANTPHATIPVELNTADSSSLRSVSGIGEVMVTRIMQYRRRLGGFVRKEQLAEIQGMSEANYERIIGQISIDTLVIQKIDVNFASHKNLVERLGDHPYMTAKVIRRLLKERQLKGGWSNIDEMVDQNIMTRGEALKLAPYLIFNPI